MARSRDRMKLMDSMTMSIKKKKKKKTGAGPTLVEWGRQQQQQQQQQQQCPLRQKVHASGTQILLVDNAVMSRLRFQYFHIENIFSQSLG